MGDRSGRVAIGGETSNVKSPIPEKASRTAENKKAPSKKQAECLDATRTPLNPATRERERERKWPPTHPPAWEINRLGKKSFGIDRLRLFPKGGRLVSATLNPTQSVYESLGRPRGRWEKKNGLKCVPIKR